MAETTLSRVSRTESARAEEEKLSRALTLGLPVITLAGAGVVGVVVGPATSILVLAGGLLLGVISLLWGSLRILTGDAPLSPELDALESPTQGVDALASRKKMLVRALKDLENERSVGKIETEDYEPIALTYRTELKSVLKRMDESLAPYRSRAEDAARLYLSKEHLTGPREDHSDGNSSSTEEAPRDRLVCPKCKASNELDARFCKGCASNLGEKTQGDEAEESTDDEDGDDAH